MAKVIVAWTMSLDGFELEIMRVVASPGVTHLRFRVMPW
jgi:hypothetical protein